MNLAADIMIAWPELFVAVAAMLLLMFGVFLYGSRSIRSQAGIGRLSASIMGGRDSVMTISPFSA